MKKYSKVVTGVLFLALAGFVLFQYQNCGGNNNNNNWSQVAASGLSYMVTVTPPQQSAVRGTQFQILTRVQASGPESLIIRIGYMQNGVQNTICSSPTQGPVTDTGNIPCYFTFSQSGPQSIFVNVDDPNYPITQPLLTCTNPPIQGCLGQYTINVN